MSPRPKIHLVPSYDGGPELWVGNDKYRLDEVTALYWMKVLCDYTYSTVHRDKGPSDAPFPIEAKSHEAA